MKVKINREHHADIDNIDRIDETPCCVLVRLLNGYPKTLKANCSKTQLLVRMVNQGATPELIKELRDK